MKKLLIILLSTSPLVAFNQAVKSNADTLLRNFQKPPSSAQPRVWWHWMNGNITKDGIRKDLEWMKRSGIGGFQNFDASLLTPPIVPKRLNYMSPEWMDAFQFTTKLADSLKLEMAIAGSPGWSETGGPWVKPEDGMKKMVWSETSVSGGTSKIKLKDLPFETGPFQNLPKTQEFNIGGASPKHLPFSKQVAIIAYKLPSNDLNLVQANATVSSSAGHFTLQQLTDGDLQKSVLLPRDSVNGLAWIQFSFPSIQEVKALTIVGGGNPGLFGQGADPSDGRTLEVSNDGIHFTFVTYIPVGAILQQTISIPTTKGKYFRVTFKNPPTQINGMAAMVGLSVKPFTPPGTEIAEIVLHTADRIDRFEEKTAFAPSSNLFSKLNTSASDVIDQRTIIELTDKFDVQTGVLNWTAPEGNWMIIRFGYSLMGIENHPASPEATGPEVDKLDPVAIKNYFITYLEKYKKATGGLMGAKGLQYMITDSWEAGAQNWTANLPQEFQKRRGYSLLTWIPAFTGHIVGSADATEKFLFDFRTTLSEMVSEYHYDALTDILKSYGMKRYSESHENGRALIADGMEVKKKAAVPMSAIWTPNAFINQNDQTYHTMDIRESGSVAHIYGQNIAAAESLTALGFPTGAWGYAPNMLKATADLAMANGLNRFVIHTSVHQPLDDKIPGIGLGPFGQWFNRHDTWAEQAKAWTDYLSRSCYLLQQGKFVADIAYYYGEDNNITSLFGKNPPQIPSGYNYDFVNKDALLHEFKAQNGELFTKTGMRYRLLVLDSNARYSSVAVLKKLKEFIQQGVYITGVKPIKSLSLRDNEHEFSDLVNFIWNSGRAFSNKALKEVLDLIKLSPDLQSSQSSDQLKFVHRKLVKGDIYWVNNRSGKQQALELSFRVGYKIPELWIPETGATKKLSFQQENGRVKVFLNMNIDEAAFIVFRLATSLIKQTEKVLPSTQVANLNNNWTVSFQKERGAPETAEFSELSSYTNNSNPGIKYFSGTASYTKTIEISTEMMQFNSLKLNLGEVKELAEVIVNGKSLGVLWHAPYVVDIKKVLKLGANTLEIKVTNLWVNRLIGDAQPGAKKITYTTMPFYNEKSPLLPSGLLGPVLITGN